MIAMHEEPLIKEIYSNLLIDEANHAATFKKFLKKYTNQSNLKEVLSVFQLFMTKKFFISIKMASTTNIDKQSIYSRLPDPKLFEHFLNDILQYDQNELHDYLLKIASDIADVKFNTINEMKQYRKSL